ncbi:glycerate kinase [Pelomonas sp. APW6]|uniref:Glycerate kinase n=1 Tax=Roseateles subflavus TaxID=3053353 RepID=A0ABT7LHN8_9BURK|nr:glycerate kinase [Pelomonas sp. APW6]MDL5031944.1 glycerate kinase [Pelomonas sp. APW6]
MDLTPRELLTRLFQAAVDRAAPLQLLQPDRIDWPGLLGAEPRALPGRCLVIGAGKASAAMAAALEAHWPAEAPLEGLVITRRAHTPPWAKPAGYGRIEIVEASHPVPDAAGAEAAARILQSVQGLRPEDRVICLISGGGSALMSVPQPGLSLADKQALNRQLLASGASIEAMNCIRKHLSAIKGGHLAVACAPARVVTLLISDVPGDDPAVIASGPTVPDPTRCADALALCERHGLQLPPAAWEGLRSGAFETPKPGDPRFAGHRLQMLATPRMSLQAAAELARTMGLAAHVLSDEIEGESREIGRMHAALASAAARHGEPFRRPCVILSGGETTVTLPAGLRGRGGRATEFLLGCALALRGEPGVHVLAADTDGIDGSEANAGAFVDPDTLARAQARGVSAAGLLAQHRAYDFFEALGDLFSPGPTFTNVNDFRALLLP